jgi:tRNA threonylcarbamoyladenosine biosynthesis protein TsaE
MARELLVISNSPEDTYEIGRAAGANLSGGWIIGLTGELGSGKTTLVQGLSRGLDVPEKYPITSPTYTIINEYPGRIDFFHVDLYRLHDESDLEEIGFFDICNSESVVAVEWAEKFLGKEPGAYLFVEIKILENESRRIKLTADDSKLLSSIAAVCKRPHTRSCLCNQLKG